MVETAVSVQFKPLPTFSNAHLGLFWARVRADYPNKSDADPIEPQTERFGSEAVRQPRLPTFRIVPSQAAARLQMSSASGDTMIQLQNGRLVFNWRRLPSGVYPRWAKVRPAFDNAVNKLNEFVAEEKIGAIQPNQWEVTYVNHLIKGREWSSPDTLNRVVPGLVGGAVRPPVGSLETLACNWHVCLPQNLGRLHIDLFHGFAGLEDGAPEILSLQLTARGGIQPESGHDLGSGLELGRSAIVTMFNAITSQEMHVLWGKEP